MKRHLIAFLCTAILSVNGFAATYYFGAFTTAKDFDVAGNWFTVSGATTGTAAPNFTTAGDVFIIDASSSFSTATFTVNTVWSIAGELRIQASGVIIDPNNGSARTGPTFGTLTISSGASATFGSSKFNSCTVTNLSNSGTLTMSGLQLTIASGGALTNNGTISSTYTAAWIVNDGRTSGKNTFGGTVELSSLTGGHNTIPSGGSFNNLTLSNTSGTNSLAASATVTVSGTLTITNPSMYLNLNGGTLTVNAFAGSGALTGSTTSSVVYTGTTNSTMRMNTTTPGTTNALSNITLGASNLLSLASTLVLNGTLTVNSGAKLELGNNLMTLNSNSVVSNSGTISSQYTTGWIVSDSRSTGKNTFGGTVELSSLTGGHNTIPSGGSFNNLTLSNTSGTNSLAASATVTVSGTLTITNPSMYLNLNGGTLTVNAFAGSGALTGSTTSSVVYTGTTNSTMRMNTTTPGTTNALSNLTINSSCQLSLGSNLRVSSTLTLGSGAIFDNSTFELNANTISSNASATIKTSCLSNPPINTTSTSIGGTVEYYSSSPTQYIGLSGINPLTYTNLTLSGGNSATKTLVGNISITGTYSKKNGTQLNLSTFNTGGKNSLDEFNGGTTTGANNTTTYNYHDGLISGNTTFQTGLFNFAGKFKINNGTTLAIGSGATITLNGNLTSTEVHEILGNISISNGGKFVVTGKKNQASGVPPFMIIKGSITESTGTANSIEFSPSNSGKVSGLTGPDNRSVIRFDGASISLGSTVSNANSIKTNANAYFQIGSGTTCTLTVNDNFVIYNGLRLMDNANVKTNNKLKLGSSTSNKFGGTAYVGYLDTVGSGASITDNVTLVETMEASRKFRFLGNPFSGNLAITDFTDDIDITGVINTNTNNFTSTVLNNPSAFTYNTSSDAWVAIESASPTVLTSLQGMRVLVRGIKTQGLDGNPSYTPSNATISISGAPLLGNQTINLRQGYNFITNPLLAPVSLSAISRSGSVSSAVSLYVPTQSGYRAYDLGTGVYTGNSSGGSIGDVWLPGSSIFFNASTTGQTVTIEDVDKINPMGKTYISYFEELDTLHNIGQVFVGHNNERPSLSDGVVLDFGSAKNATDLFENISDAIDFGSDSVNLSLITPEGKYLAISKTNALADNETRRYPLSLAIRDNSLNGKYTLRFEQFKAFESGMKVILLDKLNNVSTDLLSMPQYQFDVTADANSKGSGRFEIVVSKAQLSINDIVNKKSVDFIVNQNTQLNTTEFSFTGSTNNNQLTILDAQGKMVKTFDNFQSSVSVPNNQMKPGVYFAQVQSGDMKHTKKFIVLN